MKRIFKTILLLYMLSSCSKTETTDQQPDNNASASEDIIRVSEQQSQSAEITLGNIQRQSMGKQLRVNGVIDVPPQSMIIVSPPLGGFVKSTNLREGMKIKKGDLMVTLENMDYIQLQQDYLENQSKLTFLEAEYERQEALAAENINSGKSLQLAKSNFQTAKATVSAVEAKLGLLNISKERLQNGEIKSQVNLYSPINGFVSAVNVSIGQFFGTSETMFKIVNLDHVHLLLHVYEQDIALVEIGQKVKFRLSNGSREEEATVYLIGKEITTDKTVHVHCHLTNEKLSVIPGMYVSAAIEVTSAEVNALPEEAIVAFEDKHVIFVATASGNEFRMVEIKTGQTSGKTTEVFLPDDFDTSDKVVTKGAANLLGMMKNNPED